MKKTWKKLLAAGALALAFVSAAGLAACGGTGDGSSSGSGTGELPGDDGTAETYTLTEQMNRAEEVFDGFYEKSAKTGGLFGDGNGQAEANALAKKTTLAAAAAEEEFTREDLRNLIDGYREKRSYSNSLIIDSFVGDIFSYMQVTESMMAEYGEQSMLGSFDLNYDDVNWNDGVKQGIYAGLIDFMSRSRLQSAIYAGADKETGMIYIDQKHYSNGLRQAYLEYYYNSDGDMGVTTVNKQIENGSYYEVYIFDCAADYMLSFSFDENLENGELCSCSSVWYSMDIWGLQENEEKTLTDYARNEILRITEKTEELKEANKEKALEENKTFPEADAQCNVTYDFKKLADMLGI